MSFIISININDDNNLIYNSFRHIHLTMSIFLENNCMYIYSTVIPKINQTATETT